MSSIRGGSFFHRRDNLAGMRGALAKPWKPIRSGVVGPGACLGTALLSALLLGSCDSPTEVEAAQDLGAADARLSGSTGQTFSRELPVQTLRAGEEITRRCFSWDLGNETELWVNRIRFETTRGLHHSNWFFVRGPTYEGEEGIWPCRDRDFDTVAAAVSGGVLFAQSTQAAGESQAFPEGAALRIPPRARIVADLHLLNTYGEDVEVASSIAIDSIATENVHTRLNALAFDYPDLNIPPRSSSEFSMDCDFSEANRGPIDFDVYYALPHYHTFGKGMRLEIIGGERDGMILWEAFGTIGEPLGRTFTPALDLRGATGIRVTCAYDNPTDSVLHYGVGDQEMCVMLAFTDDNYVWGGGVLERGFDREVRNDGTSYHEAPCQMVRYPAR